MTDNDYAILTNQTKLRMAERILSDLVPQEHERDRHRKIMQLIFIYQDDLRKQVRRILNEK